MKTFSLTTFICLLSFSIFAQNPALTFMIKGRVIDSVTKQPLSFVTVSLQELPSNNIVKSSLTKDSGSFELSIPSRKNYKLILTFIGYATKNFLVNNNNNLIDLSSILMRPTQNQLSDVTITVAKPLMTRGVDRIIYNVNADPESKSLTALDMMRKVPLLSVDANDNIQLKGSAKYKILVNGKESALFAKNPSDVLRSMPGNNIVRIEVITTPPAKYDAEGLAGIINIITVKSIDQGYNFGISIRDNTSQGPGANVTATVKEGKFGFSGFAGIGSDYRVITPFDSYEHLFSDQSVLTQSGLNSWKRSYKYADGDFSYQADSLNLLTASIYFETENIHQTMDALTQTMIGDSLTQRYSESNFTNSHYQGFDASFNYQLGFKRSKEKLLTFSYKYSYLPNTQYLENDFSQNYNYIQPNYTQANNSGSREHTVQLDYTQSITKKLNMEAGAKIILRNDFSYFQADTLNNITSRFNLDPNQTQDFAYHQDIYSIYNCYKLKFDNWTAKAGIRLEETVEKANFSPVDTALKTDYIDLIPSFFLQHPLTGQSSMSFGFTERIQRPDIYELNPFINKSNPQFIFAGNPDLKPELDHVFEINYSSFSKGAINMGISYSYSNNSIQNVSSLIGDNVTYTTYQNLGSNKTFGLNMSLNYPLNDKLAFTINGLISEIWLKGSYNAGFEKNIGYVGNLFTNIGYKFNDGYRLGINTGYTSGSINLQGSTSYFIFNSYVFSKEFLGKSATMSFVANNPWGKFWSTSSYTSSPEFYQQSNNENVYRSFAIRLSYKFGKLKSDIQKNQYNINNDDNRGRTKG